VSWGPGDTELAISDPGTKGGISIVSPDGTGLRKLVSSGYDPAWSPDGRTIIYIDGGTIYAMNADGTGAHTIVKPPPSTGKHVYRFFEPAWAPNGASISFVEIDLLNANAGTLETARPDGTNRHVVAQMPTWQDFSTRSAFPFWSPDSRSIAFLELHGHQQWLVAVPSTGGKAKPLYRSGWLSDLIPASPASWAAAA
jgi:Tol biopolymer transport system component